MTGEAGDSPGVRVPPPLVFFVPLGVGVLASRWAPLPFLPEAFHRELGYLLAALSLVMFLALASFARARTNPEPWKPASALVTTGIYRFTRNPIYGGMTLLYLGVACFANSGWALMLLPLAFLVIRFSVIAREEAYLERRFGAEYLAYKRRVRRWL